MEITRFGPGDSADLAVYVALNNACWRADSPWRDALTTRFAEGYLRYGWDLEPVTPYLGWVDDQVVASGWISTSEYDNLHLAWFDVQVHPHHRRRGHGATLLRHLEQVAVARGRTTAGFGADESEALAGFALRQGYEEAHVEVIRRHPLGQLDAALVERLYDDALPHAADYVLERRGLPSPEADLAEVADLTAAINDAPTGDLAVEDEVYSPERVRAYEAAQLARGLRMYRVVARHRASGELAGHSVVAVDAERPACAEQHDTAVVATHRGHRLGLLVKLEMLRWLREAEPQIDHIDTGNAESNGHMIGVNELLGYQVMTRLPIYQRAL